MRELRVLTYALLARQTSQNIKNFANQVRIIFWYAIFKIFIAFLQIVFFKKSLSLSLFLIFSSAADNVSDKSKCIYLHQQITELEHIDFF